MSGPDLNPSTISPLKDIGTAKELYPLNPNFQQFAYRLEQEFSHWRSVRGDGNCYYRAIGVGLIERLVRLGALSLQQFIQDITQATGGFRQSPYLSVDRGLLTRYLEHLELFCCDVDRTDSMKQDALEMALQSTEFDAELVKLVRTVVSNYLADNYDSPDIQSFAYLGLEEVLRPVLTMGEAAEGLVFIGAPRAFQCTVKLITQANDSSIFTSEYSPGSLQPRFELLLWLRQGHYDLIYRHPDLIWPSPMPFQAPPPQFHLISPAWKEQLDRMKTEREAWKAQLEFMKTERAREEKVREAWKEQLDRLKIERAGTDTWEQLDLLKTEREAWREPLNHLKMNREELREQLYRMKTEQAREETARKAWWKEQLEGM